jgi:hypothetical protein
MWIFKHLLKYELRVEDEQIFDSDILGKMLKQKFQNQIPYETR